MLLVFSVMSGNLNWQTFNRLNPLHAAAPEVAPITYEALKQAELAKIQTAQAAKDQQQLQSVTQDQLTEISPQADGQVLGATTDAFPG